MAEIKAIEKYSEAWLRTMVEIWQEKIMRLKVVRTGALHQSFTTALQSAEAFQDLYMRFAKYGIYQALGVGNGYKRGNGGDLEFLGMPGKHRVKRDWYSKKLYMSVMALKEDVSRITGEHIAQVICRQLNRP